MNVSIKNNDDNTSAIITVEIVKADYQEPVEKSLHKFRQNAAIHGFRKGMVPMGMIKKIYGKQALVEEINKEISDNLMKFIEEQNIRILGEPMSNETEQPTIDFDKDEDFKFLFDVALVPEITVEVSKEDVVPMYKVNIDEDLVNKQIDAYRATYGTYDDVEAAEEKDMLKGTIAELENGAPKEGGVVSNDCVLMPTYLKDEDEKKKFIGAKVNQVIVFNPSKAYQEENAALASLLKVDKSKLADLKGDFSFEVKEIKRHNDAAIDQKLFDQVFGEGKVTTEEDFRKQIKEQIENQFVPQVDYRFLVDAREKLVAKVGDIKLDEPLVKRWLLNTNKKNTKESVDADYPKIVTDLKYHLITDYIAKKNNFTVTDDESVEYAKRVARAQFAQYGMMQVADDTLVNYAKDILKNEQTRQNIFDRALEDKIGAWLKEQVTVEEKEVSVDEFNKLFED
jgi:trigger factor